MSEGVFLDRDGTICEDVGYLSDPDEVRLISGAARAIWLLNEAHIPVVVVTNQSGVGRGYFPASTVDAINERLADELAREGATVRAFYYCPHRPEDGCDCRKPKAGLLLRAAAEYGLVLDRSFVVGDKLSDLGAGLETGSRTVLVRTGDGEAELERVEQLGAPGPEHVAGDLFGAVRWILWELRGARDPSVSSEAMPYPKLVRRIREVAAGSTGAPATRASETGAEQEPGETNARANGQPSAPEHDPTIEELGAELGAQISERIAVAARAEAAGLRLEAEARELEALREQLETARREADGLRSTVETQTEQLAEQASLIDLLSIGRRDLRAMLHDAHDQLIRRDSEIVAALPDVPRVDAVALARRIEEVVRATLPPDSTVAVVNTGDADLLALDGWRVLRFPEMTRGQLSFDPTNSASVINYLESFRNQEPGHFLVFPCTALFWIDHFEELKVYLGDHYREVVDQPDTCVIYSSSEEAAVD